MVKEGASLFVTDIDTKKLQEIAAGTGATILDQEEIYDLQMDIYAPCALGGTLNDHTIARLTCQVIAGGANNQLEDEVRHGKMLQEKGITYAPDFLINAGGVINVGAEYYGEYEEESVFSKTEKIYDTCLSILTTADLQQIPAQEAAIQAAKARIEAIGKIKLPY